VVLDLVDVSVWILLEVAGQDHHPVLGCSIALTLEEGTFIMHEDESSFGLRLWINGGGWLRRTQRPNPDDLKYCGRRLTLAAFCIIVCRFGLLVGKAGRVMGWGI